MDLDQATLIACARFGAGFAAGAALAPLYLGWIRGSLAGPVALPALLRGSALRLAAAAAVLAAIAWLGGVPALAGAGLGHLVATRWSLARAAFRPGGGP